MSGISSERGAEDSTAYVGSVKHTDPASELDRNIKNLIEIFKDAEQYLQEGKEESYLRNINMQNQQVMRMLNSVAGMVNDQKQQIAGLNNSLNDLKKTIEELKEQGFSHPKEPEDEIPEPPSKGILGAFRR